MNEALVKAAEEITQGLAKDTPLQATERTRKNTGTAIRMDTFANLLESLHEISEDHFWAAFKIAIGWRHRRNPETSMKLSLRMGGSGYDEERIQSHLKAFSSWWDHMTICRMIDKRNIAISICAEGKTYQEAGWPHHLSDKTAKKYAIDAVEEFVVRNKATKQEKSTEFIGEFIVLQDQQRPEKQDRKNFVASRIIIFEEYA